MLVYASEEGPAWIESQAQLPTRFGPLCGANNYGKASRKKEVDIAKVVNLQTTGKIYIYIF